ncbi:ribonuclease T [Thiomicrospira microaerophila]|uniref:ribonuclease T n=1 Tax=Thiomicrospira microaerophila TaxID=406020 RepID=UPI00200F515F|nr:ribonuclease T [Thiomicrospira microaerophila]UQB41836.1 ribonuclease T [Thiomicrospira microaerophila]
MNFSETPSQPITDIKQRFRGFLPVVVDVETAGFEANSHALLQVAVMTLRMDEQGLLHPDQIYQENILPFEGSKLDASALKFNGIDDPYHPFRAAKPERTALEQLFAPIRTQIKQTGCTRAILVGHNAMFDLNFIKHASERTKVKCPFHQFSTFDTVSLAGLVYGETVLSKAVAAAGFNWDNKQAHEAAYDTERTAQLFCKIVNQWPLIKPESNA